MEKRKDRRNAERGPSGFRLTHRRANRKIYILVHLPNVMQFEQLMEENRKPKQPYGQVLLLHTINKKLDSIMQMLDEQRFRIEHLGQKITTLEKSSHDTTMK